MSNRETRYVIVAPMRDEEAPLRSTRESILAQTIHPAEWIIVNDGSTDGTEKIADEYAAQYSWIRPAHCENRGYRKVGGGVVDAFNDGYRVLICSDWDFIVKLDGDLSFAPDYFEKCCEHFRHDSRLGVGGGVICHLEGREKRLEECHFRFCRKTRGPLYAFSYRIAMGVATACRMGFILALLPFDAVRGGRHLRPAYCKWNAILKWACGFERSMPSASVKG